MTKPDTKHLDTAIGIFKSGAAKRAKGTTFTLTMVGYTVGKPEAYEAVLQGPRGKTIARYAGTWASIEKAAKDHVARVPGATLTIYE